MSVWLTCPLALLTPARPANARSLCPFGWNCPLALLTPARPANARSPC
ncbi:MAG: hypothetical protein PHR96_00020 [Clostridia bacterium]|nr:hypothetical protein [Clostridia bacterium]